MDCKVWIDVAENCANKVRTLGYDVNKDYLSYNPPPHANEARKSSVMLRFVVIIAHLNLFYEVNLYY